MLSARSRAAIAATARVAHPGPAHIGDEGGACGSRVLDAGDAPEPLRGSAGASNLAFDGGGACEISVDLRLSLGLQVEELHAHLQVVGPRVGHDLGHDLDRNAVPG